MNTRRSFVGMLAALVAAMVSLASPSQAVAQAGAVVGIVLNEDRKPVADAMVELRHGDHVVARRQTNAEGKFEFARIRPGRYMVTAGKRDGGRGRELVAVKPGEPTRVRVVLHKP